MHTPDGRKFVYSTQVEYFFAQLHEVRTMADIRQALEALRAARNRTRMELTRLDEAVRALQKLAVDASEKPKVKSPKRRRKMSAAARRKIAAAQRARLAELRKEKAA